MVVNYLNFLVPGIVMIGCDYFYFSLLEGRVFEAVELY